MKYNPYPSSTTFKYVVGWKTYHELKKRGLDTSSFVLSLGPPEIEACNERPSNTPHIRMFDMW